MTRYFSREQLITAQRALDAARRTFDCTAPRVDASGAEHFETPAGQKVPYGTHGAAYLEVDPETASVRCAACAGSVPVLVAPKTVVPHPKTGKPQLVSK